MKFLKESVTGKTTFQKLFKELENVNKINSLAGIEKEVTVVYQDSEDPGYSIAFDNYQEFKSYILETYVPGQEILKAEFTLGLECTFTYGPLNSDYAFTAYLGNRERRTKNELY